MKVELGGPTPLQADPYNRTIARAHLEYMVELARTLRTTVGPDIELALDCHGAYGVSDATRLARAVEPFGLWWLEDPIPPHNVEALSQVPAPTSTPICAGENLYLRDPFARMLAAGGAQSIRHAPPPPARR